MKMQPQQTSGLANPTYDEVSKQVEESIKKGKIVLPCMSTVNDVLAGLAFSHTHNEEKLGALLLVIDGEKVLLARYVIGKIHGMKAKGVSGDDTVDFPTVASSIASDKRLLILYDDTPYKQLGIANGLRTAEPQFKSIEALAEKFVLDHYPQFGEHLKGPQVGG